MQSVESVACVHCVWSSYLTLKEVSQWCRGSTFLHRSFLDALATWVNAYSCRVRGMWEDGWMRALLFVRKHCPQNVNVPPVLTTRVAICSRLHQYMQDGKNAICGSFALHAAEQLVVHRSPTWQPNDIDFYITRDDGCAIVVDVLLQLAMCDNIVVLMEPAPTANKGVENSDILVDNVDNVDNAHHLNLKTIRTGINQILNNVKMSPERVPDESVRLRQSVQHLVLYDKHYQFHLLDVMVNGCVKLSFIFSNAQESITDVLESFDISVCKVALVATTQHRAFQFVMKPHVHDDIQKRICCGARNEFSSTNKKVDERLCKYINRGYTSVTHRCICNRRCKGVYENCACIGQFRSYEHCDCASLECCKRHIYRPATQRYYSFTPLLPSSAKHCGCGHWCERHSLQCCQCVDTRPEPRRHSIFVDDGTEPNEEYTSTIHRWVTHTSSYCALCRWDYTM